MNTIQLTLLAGLSVVAIIAVTSAAGLYGRLTDATASLKTTRSELASAKAQVLREANDHAIAVTALSDERSKAVAAEKMASDLRKQIARDAGTTRDGPTAPVLLNTLRRIGRQSP